MTGFLFGSILLLAVAAWAALFAVHAESDSAVRKLAIAFLACAPVLLFGSIILYTFGRAPAGEYRIALEAAEFDLSGGVNSVTVGGSSGNDADDVIVRDLPPKFLSFRVEGDHVVAELPEDLDQSAEHPVYAAVRVDGVRPFANSFSLAGGTQATITAKDDHAFNVLARTFEATGETFPQIPARRHDIFGLSVPIGRNLDAKTILFPVRFWARPRSSSDPVTGEDGAPLGSFLSYEADPQRHTVLSVIPNFFRHYLFVTLTGDGTSLRLANGTTKRYERTIATIPANGSHEFALFRLDYSDPKTDPDSRSVAQERRSFRATYSGGRLSIVFDTPDYVRLSAETVERLVKDQKDKSTFLLATRDPEVNAPIVANQMVLAFPQLGPRVQNELYGVINVSEKGRCTARVTSHTGTRCYGSGEGFRVGSRAAAILRITRMTIPWGIILTMFGIAVFSLAWMRRHERDTIALIIVSAAELLLAVRLLIAYEGALLDPASASALWESMAVFVLLPFTLRSAWTLNRGIASASSWLDPLRSFLWGGVAETAAVIVLVAMTLVRANVSAGMIALTCAAALLLPLIAGVGGTIFVDVLVPKVQSLKWLFVGIVSIRVLMMMIPGWKERISLGNADLALTVLYLPAVFLFFAIVWERYRQSQITPRALFWIALMGAALTVGVPVFVKDSGSALVHLPAILLFFALPLLDRRERETWLLAAPLLLIILFHVVIAPLVPHIHGPRDTETRAYQHALESESDAKEFLAERLKQSRNALRLMGHIAPHQLEEAGTSQAEGLVMQRKMLDRFSGRGWFGAGYLNAQLATFRDTHLNDNLSAIHIFAPFGFAGALGVLALLAALALLPLAVFFAGNSDMPERAIDQRAALGIMALWTFSIASIYMFAANAGVVLFTGKNVYLLAAASKSDAIEGGVLLLLALLAFTPSKAAAAKPAQVTP
jgi:hypothetical protein